MDGTHLFLIVPLNPSMLCLYCTQHVAGVHDRHDGVVSVPQQVRDRSADDGAPSDDQDTFGLEGHAVLRQQGDGGVDTGVADPALSHVMDTVDVPPDVDGVVDRGTVHVFR